MQASCLSSIRSIRCSLIGALILLVAMVLAENDWRCCCEQPTGEDDGKADSDEENGGTSGLGHAETLQNGDVAMHDIGDTGNDSDTYWDAVGDLEFPDEQFEDDSEDS